MRIDITLWRAAGCGDYKAADGSVQFAALVVRTAGLTILPGVSFVSKLKGYVSITVVKLWKCVVGLHSKPQPTFSCMDRRLHHQKLKSEY